MIEKTNVILFPRINKRMTEPSSNVIQFPGTYSRPNTMKDVTDSVEKIRQVHSDLVMRDVVPYLLIHLEAADVFNPNDPTGIEADAKHSAFMIEAVRSYVLKKNGLKHALQPLAEMMFRTDDEGTMYFTDKVKVTQVPMTANAEPKAT